MDRLMRCAQGLFLAFPVFAHVTAGDFSWVTRPGPISLAPGAAASGEASYRASHALQAIIARLLFLTVCWFSCLPLPRFRFFRHGRVLAFSVMGTAALFCYLSGGIGRMTGKGQGTAALRVFSPVCLGFFPCFAYDAEQKTFSVRRLRPDAAKLLPALFFVVCAVHTLMVSHIFWLTNEHPRYFLLRLGTLTTVVTGAFAVVARRQEC